MYNEAFFVAVSFVLFTLLMFKPAKSFIIKSLDNKILRIKSELNEAMRIREEAERLLQQYKEKTKNAEEEATEIIRHAEKQAEEIISTAKADLEFTVKKTTELATQRISQAEANALKEIKDNAIDITVGAAKALIMEHLSKEAAEELLFNAINEIERKFH